MSDTHFDLVIIGGGPAGYAAALYAGSAGLSVAMIEREKVGGTCLHRGCIPAKELLETATLLRDITRARDFGVLTEPGRLELGTAHKRKHAVIDQLTAGVQTLLKRRKVQTLAGTGRLTADRAVSVELNDGGQTSVTGECILLAAGSVPRTLPGFDVDGKLVMTSDEVLELPEVPATAAVIGGGAIGCEFASMLRDFGTQVTILEALDRIVPGVDLDVSKALARAFEKQGMAVRTGVEVQGHTPRGDGSGTTVNVANGDDVDVDLVVMSIGRRPFADLLGVDALGVETDERGFVKVDSYCRTNVEGVYALGDLIATPALAHVGFAEAIMVVQDVLGEAPVPIDYDRVPWAIYCHPEVAFAGLTESQARDAGYDVAVSKHRYVGNSRAVIIGETDGMVKIIAEQQSDGRAGRLLGVHIMGPWATEQLGQAYLAVNWEANADEVAAFIQPHPTLSELFGESVLALTGRSLHG